MNLFGLPNLYWETFSHPVSGGFEKNDTNTKLQMYKLYISGSRRQPGEKSSSVGGSGQDWSPAGPVQPHDDPHHLHLHGDREGDLGQGQEGVQKGRLQPPLSQVIFYYFLVLFSYSSAHIIISYYSDFRQSLSLIMVTMMAGISQFVIHILLPSTDNVTRLDTL